MGCPGPCSDRRAPTFPARARLLGFLFLFALPQGLAWRDSGAPLKGLLGGRVFQEEGEGTVWRTIRSLWRVVEQASC